MQNVKNTIPVYDLGAIVGPGSGGLIAEPFGAYLAVHPNLHFPHRHSFYHIVFFTKGDGYHTIDFEKFPVHPGQIYFMIPGQVHSWNFSGEVDGFVINFPEDLFRSFLSNDGYLAQFGFFRGATKESVFDLLEASFDEVKAIFEKIINEANRKEALSVDYIRACLITLFIIVHRSHPGHTPHHAPHQNQLILANFRKLVEQYYEEKRLPKEYAAMLYITPNHLNALCNDLLGKPAGEVIRDRILLEAKRLLVNMDESIAGIASRLNFTDNSHFTRFFKKNENITPEEFRKTLSKTF